MAAAATSQTEAGKASPPAPSVGAGTCQCLDQAHLASRSESKFPLFRAARCVVFCYDSPRKLIYILSFKETLPVEG